MFFVFFLNKLQLHIHLLQKHNQILNLLVGNIIIVIRLLS